MSIERINELEPLLQKAMGDKFDSTITAKVVAFEDEMSNSRELLECLLERGILEESEYDEKVFTCYFVFQQNVWPLIGQSVYEAVYDI